MTKVKCTGHSQILYVTFFMPDMLSIYVSGGNLCETFQLIINEQDSAVHPNTDVHLSNGLELTQTLPDNFIKHQFVAWTEYF